MSGLYNMIFGENEHSNILLACLGLTKDDCGRYRDCFINDGKIVIHTRNGGGNRESYQEVFDELSTHENYLSDEDDDFDCTYANIYFSFPEKYKELLEGIATSKTPNGKWAELFKSFKGD